MGNKRLTIVQINDEHGYLDLHQELFWQNLGLDAMTVHWEFAYSPEVLKERAAEP